MNKKIITNNFLETQQLGFDLAKTLKGEVLCLHGDLGSGKTTFVQGLAKGLGIQQRIISPTFIIVRTYEIKNQKSNLKYTYKKLKMFYHMDLYRIKDEEDVEGLGLLEIMQDKDNIVVIEWPEKIEKILPSKRTDLFFKYIDENKREIVFE